MAVTTQISTAKLPAAQKPVGYNDATITIALGAGKVRVEFSHSLNVSGIADTTSPTANQVNGMAQLMAALKTWIDGTFFPTNLQICGTNDVEGIIYLTNVDRRNTYPVKTVDGIPGEIPNQYILGVEKYYIKGYVEYQAAA